MIEQIVLCPCNHTKLSEQNLHLFKLQPKDGGNQSKTNPPKPQKNKRKLKKTHSQKVYIKTLYVEYVKYMHSGKPVKLNNSAPSMLASSVAPSNFSQGAFLSQIHL